MNLNELLEYLDIETPEEFEYFEHLADLLELEEEISYEACFGLFSALSETGVTELIANYFEELIDNLPDDTIDIFTLLTTIRQCLLGLARGLGSPEGTRAFVDEFLKFRSWYTLESVVHCKRLRDGLFTDVTAAEAIALCRLEKLNEDEYDYDFSDCLEYEVSEYSVNLADIIEDSELEEDSFDSQEDHPHRHHHRRHEEGCGCGDEYDEDRDEDLSPYREGLVDQDNPVIDGEYEDE